MSPASPLLLTISLLFAVAHSTSESDWLISPPSSFPFPTLTKNADTSLTLSNGLISKTFAFGAGTGFGTIDFRDEISSTSLLRAIEPEGYVSLSGLNYSLGSLIQTGTEYHAYLNRSSTGIVFNPDGFDAISYSLGTPQAPFAWTPGTRGSPLDAEWPPKGLQVAFSLRAPLSAPASIQAVAITIVYEIYPGIPLLTKWVTINSNGSASAGVLIDSIITDSQRLAGPYTSCSLGSQSPSQSTWEAPPSLLYVATDQAHGTQIDFLTDGASVADPGAVECALQTSYTSGPGVVLSGSNASSHFLYRTLIGDSVAEFVSFRTFQLLLDSYDKERTALATKRLFRLWAPHAQENPIFFHATDTSDVGFKLEIDQMKATGFEMLIYSFGSGFNLETVDAAYLASVKSQIDYAKSQGIEVGGYDLVCLDRGNGGYGGNVGDEWDAVGVDGVLLPDACFASGWVEKLTNFATTFIDYAGLSMLETDGPYGGGSCASHNHSHHSQLSDSIYHQTQVQAQWYAGLRAKNIYINQPDRYFFQGGQRTGLGYDEDQYSLPRWQDVTVSRQTVYDQTFAKIPTSGWMFLPLVDYHGGGADAAFEPMSQHLPEFEMALAQYLGAGIAACYRGYRLFDSPAAQAVVTKWVSIYKEYRDIITSDLIHIRRPDGQSIDAFMHANAFLPLNQGFAVLFNPTCYTLTQNITFPLYYTGLDVTANFSHEGATPVTLTLNRDFTVTLSVTMERESVTWYVISKP